MLLKNLFFAWENGGGEVEVELEVEEEEEGGGLGSGGVVDGLK